MLQEARRVLFGLNRSFRTSSTKVDGDGRVCNEVKDSILAIDLERVPDFKRLDKIQSFEARAAIETLKYCSGSGCINFSDVRSIADFGADEGGLTFALQALARTIKAKVTAIEKEACFAELIVELGTISEKNLKIGNGLKYLEGLRGYSGHGFDLITAFMFGPDWSGNYFRQLANASYYSLNQGGNLLLNSDRLTMTGCIDYLGFVGADFTTIKADSINDRTLLIPDTLVIPKESCNFA